MLWPHCKINIFPFNIFWNKIILPNGSEMPVENGRGNIQLSEFQHLASPLAGTSKNIRREQVIHWQNSGVKSAENVKVLQVPASQLFVPNITNVDGGKMSFYGLRQGFPVELPIKSPHIGFHKLYFPPFFPICSISIPQIIHHKSYFSLKLQWCSQPIAEAKKKILYIVKSEDAKDGSTWEVSLCVWLKRNIQGKFLNLWDLWDLFMMNSEFA